MVFPTRDAGRARLSVRVARGQSVLGNHDYRGDPSLSVGRHVGLLDFPAKYYDW